MIEKHFSVATIERSREDTRLASDPSASLVAEWIRGLQLISDATIQVLINAHLKLLRREEQINEADDQERADLKKFAEELRHLLKITVEGSLDSLIMRHLR